MILSAQIHQKTLGNKLLLENLDLTINKGEKVALIGRNGVGKTTLLRMLAGVERDYDGTIHLRKNLKLISTFQEHHFVGKGSALDYIYHNLPGYPELKEIVDTYPTKMGDNIKLIHRYSEALQKFTDLGYFNLEKNLLQALGEYQIDEEMARRPFKNLSGGQKRFVDLVRVQFANADIALVDEPTNHMDYIAKDAFIKWLDAANHACLIVTHDRDVLGNVERIIEIKDKTAVSFKGNYDDYLRQNTSKTTTQLQSYEVAQQTIANLKKQIAYAKSMKPKWSGTADKKNPFVVMEERLTRQLEQTIHDNPKPSFWIDQESAAGLNPKMAEKYDKYKERNIRLHRQSGDERETRLLEVDSLVLGYDKQALFKPVSFALSHGEHLHLVGRNGAGKTTLVKAIVTAYHGKRADTLITGLIDCSSKLRLSVYEQEVGLEFLKLSLYDAIEKTLYDSQQPVTRQYIMRLMGDYLFDPNVDSNIQVTHLSGGQKARLQLIKMLASEPNLLILDEPTNHLDLPSIEELEKALSNYHGAVLYVSHDSYFSRNVGGEQLKLVSA